VPSFVEGVALFCMNGWSQELLTTQPSGEVNTSWRCIGLNVYLGMYQERL